MNVRVAISMTDGRVFHMLVVGRGRFAALPRDGFWSVELDGAGQPTGYYVRDANDPAVISHEINKSSYLWVKTEGNPVLPVSWRPITEAEAQLFDEDRTYRDALVFKDDMIRHDLVRARDCHRRWVRKQRMQAMAVLDAEWMKAMGQNKDIKDVESKRQRWRDAPADPRIEKAKSIDDLKQIEISI